MAPFNIIRRLTRFFHCQRSVAYFLIFIAIFVIYYFYSNPNEELEFLRTQFDLHISKLHQLEKELSDANNKLQNSEMECQTNLEALKQKRNGGNSDFRMVQPRININANSNNNNFANNNNFGHSAEQQPKRGDSIPIEGRRGSRINNKEGKAQDGDYPKLTDDGNFLPNKLWVHFDFKGAPLKPSYFLALLPFLKKIGINGILLEWEDQFPYSGKLATAVNGEAYSMEEVEQMLGKAKELGFEIIPLVQTFGHLEWILKLKQFAHLREDQHYPQVICFGSPQAWELLEEMIKQVAEMHKRFGMNYFHIGADEVFQLGGCNESMQEIRRQGGRERAILWHISRTAAFLKKKYSVTVLAWHDMLVQSTDRELLAYNLPDVLEPVLWSYAEDLDAYLPYSNWISLKPFKNVWGSSAFKGADGPMRISTNSMHYIRNHESWIEQMTRIYKEFERFQGLIITGWSRYDHLAVLCELWPVAIPTLAMAVETILAGKPMNSFYEKTNELLQCNAPLNPGYAFGCRFPGSRIYELVNEFAAHSEQFRKYAETDFDFNGWVSMVAEKWNSSSPMYIEKVLPYIDFYLQPMERIERELRIEMPKYFRAETADEFIFTYMSQDLEFLRRRKAASEAIMSSDGTFPKRPFIQYKTRQYSSSKKEHSSILHI